MVVELYREFLALFDGIPLLWQGLENLLLNIIKERDLR